MATSLTNLRKNSTLRHDIIQALEQAILDGELKAGTALSQADLAEQFGVSRAPVREALQHLEQTGLVTYAPHKGYTITEFTEKNVRELYGLRLAIEPYALRLAVERFDEDKIAALEDVVTCMDQAANRGDVHQLIRCDLAFHRIIYEESKHRLLRRIWDIIEAQLRLFIGSKLRREGLLDIPHEAEAHAKVLGFIRNGDTEEAVQALKDLIVQFGEEAASAWPADS